MNKLISTKDRVFISLVGPSGSGKSRLIFDWLKIGTFQPEFDKIYYFYQHYQPLYGLMKEKVKNIEFINGIDFQFIEQLPNNAKKYLLIFDDSCEEIFNSKEFVKVATAGRHRGLNTIYIKHNLFHKSKLGRDVELQNTHIVLFKSPRDVLQINTLGTQLGLGSQLKEWYQDATSVPYGHLLIDLSPKTVDYLRYCTNSGSAPTKFYLPKHSQKITFLDDEHTISLYAKHVPKLDSKMQKVVFTSLPERLYRVHQRMHRKHVTRTTRRSKENRRTKISKRNKKLARKRTPLHERRKILSSTKGLNLIATITKSVIVRLS